MTTCLVVGLLVSALVSGGCGTLLMASGGDGLGPIYGGTQFDVAVGILAVETEKGSIWKVEWYWLPLVAVDLPLSLAADTVILPVTVGYVFAGPTRPR